MKEIQLLPIGNLNQAELENRLKINELVKAFNNLQKHE